MTYTDFRQCSVGNCRAAEYDVTAYVGPGNKLWFVGYCEDHYDTEEPEPPAGFEPYMGGGDPTIFRSWARECLRRDLAFGPLPL